MNTQPLNPELAALPDLFLLNEKNRAFVEGKSTRIAHKAVWSKWTLFWIIPVLPLLFVAGHSWFSFQVLSNSGANTEGTITGRWEESCDGTCYSVGYTFTVEGQNYSSKQGVSYGLYAGAEEGSPVEVVYAPDNPQMSSLRSALAPPVGWALFAVVFVGIILFYRARVLIARRSARRLAKGHLLRGEVTRWQTEEKAGEEGDKYFSGCLDYIFNTPDGRKRGDRAVIQFSVREMKKFAPPPLGTSVGVLYVDDNLYAVL